ncbi:MAG: hypothetical protein M1832_003170 [Thelocarpon impressellum]|nr:MAG: hypothetical protein M1832_003170 [Thelocarpon impressellum]
MPFFRELKDLRRRSRASFRTDQSSGESSNGNGNGNGIGIGISPVDGNGHLSTPRTQSTSTLSSHYGSTLPAPLQSHFSSPNLHALAGKPAVPPRPNLTTPKATNRYSISGMTSPSLNGSVRTIAPPSPYAPRVLSVSDNSWVHQKVLLIYGQIGDPAQNPLDGNLTVYHHQDAFPAVSWPVCDSHFKALVYLTPGPNRLRLDVSSPKLPSSGSSNPAHSSWININYLPLASAPPVHLAILVAKDSPMTFDAVPERVQREGNGIDMAIKKFRMAAYLWQAYTGEQMYRNRFGRRCWRFDEEWQTGTLSARDKETGQMRGEARVHVIRLDQTVAEIQALDIAQQYGPATRKDALFGIAVDATRAYFKPAPNQKQYVSALILDTHWDTRTQVIRGHAALGGGAGDMQLGICGSQALQSYPACLEEVVAAFTDCTRTDTKHVANDLNESGSNWEAANIGIGAHMHETGHMFGCPHQENGVMARDYVTLNRTFTTREPYSTRTKSPGLRLCLPKDECTWHRLDILRFRYHPCFRLPTDVQGLADDSVQVWAIDNNQVVATATTGIAFIELITEEERPRAHVEYADVNGSGGPPRQVTLNEADLRARLPEDRRNKRLQLDIYSAGMGRHVIEDFAKVASKLSTVKLANGQLGYRGKKLGASAMDGSAPEEVILASAVVQTKLLVQIKVYHGFALDGLEFVYEDFTSQLFGKRGGSEGGSKFDLDTRRGEVLMGFNVRAGLWLDGIEILTSLGRRSGVFGNALGGSGHTLIPPRGYSIAGVYGSSGSWMDGFGLIITRG